MKKYFQAPWSLKDILKILLSIAALISAVIYLVDAMGVSEPDSLSGGGAVLLVFVLQWTAMFLPIFIFTKGKERFAAKNFALNKIGIGKTIWMVIKAYFLYFTINILVGILIIFHGIEIPGYQVQEEIIPLFGNDLQSLIIAGVTIVIIAPVLEEIVFRGFLLRGLVNQLGVIVGSIISAAIFSALHFPWQTFIPIFILGLIMNSMVLKSKSVIPSIAFHITNNLIAFTIQVLIMKNPQFFEDALQSTFNTLEKLV
jgi:uncharacterized protein